MLVEQPTSEREDVARPFAQRRDGQRDDFQPVVQVFAKAAVPDGRRQIAVRRGNESNVGALRAVAAQALVLALLQHAQQLGLHDERQLADLVEEERATARGLDAPRTGPIGPGERAALMAEELALQQLALEHSAVDGEDGLLAARALLVDRARHDLLAGTRFAEQQHGRRAW